MQDIKNFQRYTPQKNKDNELLLNANVVFYQSEDGKDWYQCQKSFAEGTVKFTYNKDGIICSIENDVTALCPVDKSVAELPQEKIPDGCDIHGNWQYIDGEITPRIPGPDELIAQARQKQIALLNDAANKIAPLQDAVDLGDVTEKEMEQLSAWKKYRVLLMRVDTSTAPGIEWPTPPVILAK